MVLHAHIWFLLFNTVKPASTTTSLKRPLALNDRFKSPKAIPCIFYILLSDHLLDATNDHVKARANGTSFNGHLNA